MKYETLTLSMSEAKDGMLLGWLPCQCLRSFCLKRMHDMTGCGAMVSVGVPTLESINFRDCKIETLGKVELALLMQGRVVSFGRAVFRWG